MCCAPLTTSICIWWGAPTVKDMLPQISQAAQTSIFGIWGDRSHGVGSMQSHQVTCVAVSTWRSWSGVLQKHLSHFRSFLCFPGFCCFYGTLNCRSVWSDQVISSDTCKWYGQVQLPWRSSQTSDCTPDSESTKVPWSWSTVWLMMMMMMMMVVVVMMMMIIIIIITFCFPPEVRLFSFWPLVLAVSYEVHPFCWGDAPRS